MYLKIGEIKAEIQAKEAECCALESLISIAEGEEDLPEAQEYQIELPEPVVAIQPEPIKPLIWVDSSALEAKEIRQPQPPQNHTQIDLLQWQKILQ